MKKIASLLALFLVIGYLSGCSWSKKQNLPVKTEAPAIKIGAILPLSGSVAQLGVSIQQGISLRQKQINENGGINGQMLDIVFEDSMGDITTAVTAYHKLVTQDINALIVATGAEAIAPLAEKEKIPMLATFNSAAGIPEMGEYIFRFFTNADMDVPVLADFATGDLKLKKFAIIYPQEEYGISYANKFASEVEKAGGEVADKESYLFTEKDYRTQLLKIRGKSPDGIYLIGYDFQIITILGKMAEMDMSREVTKLAIGTITTQEAIVMGSGLLEGTYSSAFCNPLPKDYILAFSDKFSQLPPFFSVFGYDSLRLLENAIEILGSSRDNIRDGLAKTKDIDLLIGKVSMSPVGEASYATCPMKIDNNKLLNLKTNEYYKYPNEIIKAN